MERISANVYVDAQYIYRRYVAIGGMMGGGGGGWLKGVDVERRLGGMKTQVSTWPLL